MGPWPQVKICQKVVRCLEQLVNQKKWIWKIEKKKLLIWRLSPVFIQNSNLLDLKRFFFIPTYFILSHPYLLCLSTKMSKKN